MLHLVSAVSRWPHCGTAAPDTLLSFSSLPLRRAMYGAQRFLASERLARAWPHSGVTFQPPHSPLHDSRRRPAATTRSTEIGQYCPRRSNRLKWTPPPPSTRRLLFPARHNISNRHLSWTSLSSLRDEKVPAEGTSRVPRATWSSPRSTTTS